MLKTLYSFLLILASLVSISQISQISQAQIIAVGGSDESEFLPLLVERAGGSKANIYVIAAARLDSKKQQETINAYKRDFINLGVSPKSIYGDIILSENDANSQVVIDNISIASAICVSGGDQHTLVSRIINTKLHKIILQKVAAGCVYYGNSAGTAAIGDQMIAGDHDGSIVIEQGLGLTNRVVFDQHYSERKRQWRIKKFLDKYPDYIGIGVDESTAVIIEKDERKVIGTGKKHEVALK